MLIQTNLTGLPLLNFVCKTGKEAIPETGDNEYNPSAPEPGYRQNEHLPPSEIAAPVGTRAELRCSVQNRSKPLSFIFVQTSL